VVFDSLCLCDSEFFLFCVFFLFVCVLGFVFGLVVVSGCVWCGVWVI